MGRSLVRILGWDDELSVYEPDAPPISPGATMRGIPPDSGGMSLGLWNPEMDDPNVAPRFTGRRAGTRPTDSILRRWGEGTAGPGDGALVGARCSVPRGRSRGRFE